MFYYYNIFCLVIQKKNIYSNIYSFFVFELFTGLCCNMGFGLEFFVLGSIIRSILNINKEGNMSIKNLAKHEQPREKLMEKGSSNLRDAELMAILLRTGIEGKDVIKVSEEILTKFPKKKLLSLDFESLSGIKGIGEGKACLLLAAFELTKRAMELEDNTLPIIRNARDAVLHLQDIRNAKKEHFVALYLNARNQLVHRETISIGTLNASLVHPREVFKPAIDCLAASIIVAHNHPSGGLEPSEADVMLTGRLHDAGALLGVDLRDHLIVTGEGFCSII